MYYSYENCLEKKALFNFITWRAEETERLTVLKRRLLVKIILKKMKILFIYEDLKRN